MSTRSELARDFRYVDLAAGGVNRRNNPVPITEVRARLNGEPDCYVTVHRFPTAFRKHVERTGSVKDYSGASWADYVPFDVDREDDLEQARRDTLALGWTLQETYGVRPDQLRLFFSGRKGFHVLVPIQLFGPVEPSPDLAQLVNDVALEIADEAGVEVDSKIYDRTRLFRLPNTEHGDSGLYKVELSWEELANTDPDGIRKLAREPRNFDWSPDHLEARPELEDVLVRAAERPAEDRRPRAESTYRGDGLADALLEGWNRGDRNRLALAFGGWAAKSSLPRERALGIMEEVVQRAGDEEPDDRLSAVARSFDKVRAGEPVRGYAELEETLPSDALQVLDRAGPRAPRPERDQRVEGEQQEGGGDQELPELVPALEVEVPPPPEFQVEGFTLKNEFGMLVADGGNWKTTAALHIAGAVAGGYPVFDSRVFHTEQAPVLYVSEEDDAGVLLNRLEAMIDGHGWDRDRVLGNLYPLAREGVTLDRLEWRDYLAEKVEEHGIELVVLDPYAELTLAKEDQNDEVKPLVRFWRRLNGLGATVLLLHHLGKKYEGRRLVDRIRGASALNQAARFIYGLDSTDLGFSVKCVKLSRAEEPATFVVRTDISSDPDNRAVWTSARLSYISEHAAEDMVAETFVLEHLTTEPGPNGSELKKAASEEGLSPTEVSEALKTLRDAGTIDFERGAHNAKMWYLTHPVASPAMRPPENRSHRSHMRPPEETAGGYETPIGFQHPRLQEAGGTCDPPSGEGSECDQCGAAVGPTSTLCATCKYGGAE